jgi:hypothetical protein
MAGKKVSLSKILNELKAVIEELEREDPGWSADEKKKAKHTAKQLRSLSELTASQCTDGQMSVPSA